ncbi:hypothetical protein [[Eubacterium] hominis]|uniref:hypothetical protein n=1 Tax=[Eubacterium] hominis TaxID=2764325 RepID=UPI003A4E0DA2
MYDRGDVMRRCSLIAICLLVLLCGCSGKSKKEEESMKNYETFINAVMNNKGNVSKTIPFDYKLIQQKQADGSYKYEVIINNPRVAMYDIQAIAIDQAVDSNTNIYPCLGLVGDDIDHAYSMLPFQAYPDLDYWQGIILDGISKEKQFTLNVLVSWSDATRTNKFNAFFNLSFAEESSEQEKE